MKNFLDLTIVSPNGMIYNGKADSVELPGTNGSFTVYPRHAAIISSLAGGKIVYKVDKESKEVKISGGFVEVLHDMVSICIEQ